jgi:high-affinity iron transporter
MDRRGQSSSGSKHGASTFLLVSMATLVVGFLVWQGVLSQGDPDPLKSGIGVTAATLNVAVLVFREGLECILVLSAITANMMGSTAGYRRPVAIGAAIGLAATLVTWQLAVAVIDDLAKSIPMLHLQSITGLLAVLVLIVVMNWFFHKVYWTGWISLHTKKKGALLQAAADQRASAGGLLFGLGLLGFSSLYREGFEVVLFLQSYRLRLGTAPVFDGVLIGTVFTCMVAVVTFFMHQRLPYRRMLVVTGVLLTVVLTVMVGEQAQEMQLANWLPTTEIPALVPLIPAWVGLWFAVFPTVEGLSAQTIALAVVLASYAVAERSAWRAAKRSVVRIEKPRGRATAQFEVQDSRRRG